jgi:hypothetical protein
VSAASKRASSKWHMVEYVRAATNVSTVLTLTLTLLGVERSVTVVGAIRQSVGRFRHSAGASPSSKSRWPPSKGPVWWCCGGLLVVVLRLVLLLVLLLVLPLAARRL